jgi:hypothetical protein
MNRSSALIRQLQEVEEPFVFSEKTEKRQFFSIVTRNCYVSMGKTLCSNIARF